MNSAEEKFFEDLARFGPSNHVDEGAPVAELAKASTAAAPKAVVRREEESSGEPEGQLTIDVYQTPDEIVIESAIAGVKPEDIDIDVSGDSITIRGSRHRESHVREEDYFYQECYWGRFSRSVILPQEVDPESASVTFKNGVLTVKLPKLSRKKSRKLKVRME